MNEPNRPVTPAGAPLASCVDQRGCVPQRCVVCLKEVPADALNVSDAEAYVHYFCGLACLDTWRRHAKSALAKPVKP